MAADLHYLRELLAAAGQLCDEDVEGLSILDHGLQCAARLAERAPHDQELQAAGLVHDLGWIAADGRGGWRVRTDAAHDAVGARLVEPVLGARVARLVGGHVDAKRYLVARESSYADGLSATSSHTLQRQGGAMSAAEMEEFDCRPDRDALIALRRADEQAKLAGETVAGLDRWLPLLERLSVRAMQRGAGT